MKKGLEYLEKSIELGYEAAACYLGKLYYNGKVVKKDYKKAATYFQIAANAGHAWAICYLGMCYQYGNGFEKNENKAMELFIRAEALKDSEATYHKINLMLRADDLDIRNEREAFDYIKLCVETNRDTKGKYALELACLHRDGCSLFEPDREKAIYYFKLSHAKGNSGGTFGLLKEYLKDCPDRETAEQAYSLALEYKKQKWVDKAWAVLLDYMDDTELRKAAAQKYLEKSFSQSFAAYQKLSKTCDDANYALGVMSLLGYGTEQSNEKAMEYLEKAATSGVEEAKSAISLIQFEEKEKTVIKCPYCNHPIFSETEKYHCDACGSNHLIRSIKDADSIMHFNRANRLNLFT